MTICTIVLCTNDVIIIMCHCMLSPNPGMLPYLMVVYVYELCVHHMFMQILTHYGSMYPIVNGISISLHLSSTVPFFTVLRRLFLLVRHIINLILVQAQPQPFSGFSWALTCTRFCKTTFKNRF